MLLTFSLLKHTGQFDYVDSGGGLPLNKLNLIYAENGRGKTTLSAVLRSLRDGNADMVMSRKRLGAPAPPHIVFKDATNNPYIFSAGAWTRTAPQLEIFDDEFVADNVCSGLDVDPTHRQGLYTLILGALGVALNVALVTYQTQIEDHNKAIREKGEKISAAVRGAYSVDDFCALANLPDVEESILGAERELAAARDSVAIAAFSSFTPFSIPTFDADAVTKLLQTDLVVIDQAAANRVSAHIGTLGSAGEEWVADGMLRTNIASANRTNDICPFCAQDLQLSTIFADYRAYFSDEYQRLKLDITAMTSAISATHSSDARISFTHAANSATSLIAYWSMYTEVPAVEIDSAEITRIWTLAFSSIISALRRKATEPLLRSSLPPEAIASIADYNESARAIDTTVAKLIAANERIAVLKAKTAAANIQVLSERITTLKAIKARYSKDVSPLCTEYAAEKDAKSATEALRDAARAYLDRYRQTEFPKYEALVNTYLRKFNAGYELTRVKAENQRAVDTCSYQLLIDGVRVPLASGGIATPSFKTTLSAGDRNSLALAFFFAALESDPNMAQKIVVIDDPMTSLDEHRSRTTIKEIHRLAAGVSQVIVLSHSKPLLCALWDKCDQTATTTLKIARHVSGSTISAWDVTSDMTTLHDHLHKTLRDYLVAPATVNERNVAQALRPVIEGFARVAFPEIFMPGDMLGKLINTCTQRAGRPNEVLSQTDIQELSDLVEYGNLFHHNTNPGTYSTVAINDGELRDYCERTLRFATRA